MELLVSLAATPSVLSLAGDSAGAAASFASSLTLVYIALGALRARPLLRFFLRAVALIAALAAVAPLLFFLISKRASSAAPDVFLALCAGVGAVFVDANAARAMSCAAERATVAHVGTFALRATLLTLMNDAHSIKGSAARVFSDAAIGASSARALAGAAVLTAAGATLLARVRAKDARVRALAVAVVIIASLIPFYVSLRACAMWVPGAIAARPVVVFSWCAACVALLPLPAARDAAGIVRARKVYHLAFASMVVIPMSISFRRGAAGVSSADVSFIAAALAGALLGFVILETARALDVLPPRISALVRERLHRHADKRDNARGVLLPHIALVAGTLFPLLVTEISGAGAAGAAPAVAKALEFVHLTAAPIAVGVGDATAALVGLWSARVGVARPWVGSSGKTVNGTVAFAASALAVHVAVLAFVGGGGALSIKSFFVAGAAAVAGAVAEVLSGDVDNIVVPCAAWAAALIASK